MSQDDRDRHQLLKSEAELKAKIKELEKGSDQIHSEEILGLKARLTASQRNSEFLSTEMKTICEAMLPLESRISEVVLTLVQKETQIETLLAEVYLLLTKET